MPIASDTVAVSLFTVLPFASSIVTLGCVGNAAPPVELAGCWVKTSVLAAPMTGTVVLRTDVFPTLSVPVSTYT